MSLIQQQPDPYNFAGNIADIVLTSDASVTLSIPLLLEEVYFPDSNGRITIPLRAFFEAHLHAAGLEEIPEDGLDLTAYTYYIDGQECGTFHVLAGGVDSPSVDTELFLKSNFLTWQPQTRFVTYHEPQWLRYVALQACTVKVKGYFDDGNTATVTLKDLTANKQYNLDVNYGRIRGMFESQPAYYDVWVEAEGGRLSFVQRYVFQDEFSTNVDFFVFENSLGGYDTIRFTGDRKEVTEAESLNAVFDAETNEYGIDYSKSWTKYTGYLPNERSRLWALEFFSSSQKYHLSDRSLRRIVVSKPKLEATSGEVSGYEFTFAYSQQSRYLNISREELPDHLEIIGPGDELFFLTPRLNEFPILDTTQDILIPAQYPYSEEWGILSLASLLKSLTNESESGSGTYFHDQLLNLDKANQHPIKAISGLQAALDKKVSLSVYEQFVQTYNNHVLSAAHLTNEQQSILSRFSIVDGRLQIDGDAYTTGWLAQLGAATGEGGTGGSGTMYHELLEHLDWPNQHPIEAITGLQDALNGKASADHVHSWASLTDKPTTLSGFGITDGVDKDSFDTHVRAFDTHANSDAHLTAGQRAVLSMLSVDTDGNLKIDGNAFTTGWLAQLGAATGEGGTGGSGTMYHDQLEHLDWPNQHPIEAITGLQDALNGKLATSAISAWALQPEKPSYTWAEISGKPSVFTPSAHTHGMSEINGLNAALAGKLGVDHASDTTLHLTTGQRAVLAMLSVDTDGNLKIDGNAFTTGWLAQLGAATGEGGTGGGGTLYHDELEHLDYPDQHPIAAIVGLQSALNGKASTALVTTSASGLMSATDKAKLDGIAAGANNYVLPIASASVLGGIRVGSRLSIASGVLSANAQAWSEITGKPTTFTPAAHTQGWDTITGKPTTLSGYGITDAMTASAINTALAGKVGKAEKAADSTLFDGYGEAKFWRKDRKTVDLGTGLANLPVESGSYIVYSNGWTGSAFVFNAAASNSGLAFYRPGGGNYRPQLLIGLDSIPTKWTNLGELVVKSDLASYLPLTGGTVAGRLIIDSGSEYRTLTLKNSYTGLSNIAQIFVGGNNELVFRALPNGNSDDYSIGKDLRLRHDGTITWGGNSVWHAGNSNISTVDWTCLNLNAYGRVAAQTSLHNISADDALKYANGPGFYNAAFGWKEAYNGASILLYRPDSTKQIPIVFCTGSGTHADITIGPNSNDLKIGNYKGAIRLVGDVNMSASLVVEGNIVVRGTITQLGG